MNSLHRCIGFFVIALALHGCAAPYYGLTEEEWNSLDEKGQTAIKAEYQNIIALQENQERRKPHDARTQSIIDYGLKGPKYGR